MTDSFEPGMLPVLVLKVIFAEKGVVVAADFGAAVVPIVSLFFARRPGSALRLRLDGSLGCRRRWWRIGRRRRRDRPAEEIVGLVAIPVRIREGRSGSQIR